MSHTTPPDPALNPTTQSSLEGPLTGARRRPAPYPPTKRLDIRDEYFGGTVVDPYRWLENDTRVDAEVAAWVASQNKFTRSHLDSLPGRAIFRDRLERLFNYERFTLPVKKGSRYFYLRNSGAEHQMVLYVRDSVDGPGRILLDPNTLVQDGTTALAEWSPSQDGKYVAFALQDGGSDWRTIGVLDVATGRMLGDEVKWARFTSIAWAMADTGFFYTRFPEPGQGAADQARLENHAVYFHALGTPQASDRKVFATPEQPAVVHFPSVTSDGRYLVISSTPGTLLANILTVVDLHGANREPRVLFGQLDCLWSVVGNVGTTFFIQTSQDAPRSKVVAIDLAAAALATTEIVPEQDSVLSGATLVGERLLLSYMVDVKTEVRRYTLEGTADGTVMLPGIGTALGFEGSAHDNETFFGFTSFDFPGTIFRYDVVGNSARIWSEADVGIDLDDIAVEQHFFTSKDGTRIPMFVVRRKSVTDPAPTLLTAYGGYGLIDPPGFSPAKLAWVEQGGVFAVAHIRGGGEYGRTWHEAGRRHCKQNVFDDFIAAGEYLKAQGITASDGLGIQGASNGGLLIGAVVNQRPDLFAVALPQVGVMDMLRFNQFTGGMLWVDEHGDPAKEADFRTLMKYSPYHNIQSGKPYPAILATTADADDRVLPLHTFKYIAALQAADIGAKPALVRVDTRAGHGAGKSVEKIIEEIADMWAFAAHWARLPVRKDLTK